MVGNEFTPYSVPTVIGIKSYTNSARERDLRSSSAAALRRSTTASHRPPVVRKGTRGADGAEGKRAAAAAMARAGRGAKSFGAQFTYKIN